MPKKMYKLSKGYRWYSTTTSKFIVLMYFINEMPYTFDALRKNEEEDLDIILEATANHVYTEIEVYSTSYYLIQEEAHPLLFEMELQNPEFLPTE